MRPKILAFSITIALGIAVGAHAGAGPLPSTPAAPVKVKPAPHPYPAIAGWMATKDGVVVGLLLSLVRKYNRGLNAEEVLTIVDAVLAAHFRHDLDPLLVASIIAAESSFNLRARSHCGAEGLMQLTPGLQPWVGVSDPYDIRQNVAGGCRYLDALKKRFGRLDLALAAYNAGPTRVARLGRVPRIRETVRYLRRIEALHTRLVLEARRLEIDGERSVTLPPFSPA
ncbi:MAG: lytic transglycosylase domain-containing protein [Bacillota bacterium]